MDNVPYVFLDWVPVARTSLFYLLDIGYLVVPRGRVFHVDPVYAGAQLY
jgi:hypothetical protein